MKPNTLLQFLRTHVRGHVDLVGELGDVDLEAALDFFEDLLVGLTADEGNGQSLGSKPAGPPYTMEELVRVVGKIVIDHDVDPLDVDPTSEQVGRHEDAGVEVLEGLVLGDAFLLLHPGVDANGRKVAFCEEPIEFLGAVHFGHKDDDLVELEGVEQVVQFAILLGFGQLAIVQLQPVQREFGLVVDVNLHGILAELAAHRSNVLGKGGTEEHDLLLVRGQSEDLLDVAAHVKCFQHAIAFVEDKMFDGRQQQRFFAGKGQDTSRRPYHDVRSIILQNVAIGLDVDSTVKDGRLDGGQILAEAFVFVRNLEGQFAGVTQDQNLHVTPRRGGCGASLPFGGGRRSRPNVELVQRGQDKDGGLAHP